VRRGGCNINLRKRKLGKPDKRLEEPIDHLPLPHTDTT
jgi:hypothetical protein